MTTFDWHSGDITRATELGPSHRNTQKVRRFFKAECGDTADQKISAVGRRLKRWGQQGSCHFSKPASAHRPSELQLTRPGLLDNETKAHHRSDVGAPDSLGALVESHQSSPAHQHVVSGSLSRWSERTVSAAPLENAFTRLWLVASSCGPAQPMNMAREIKRTGHALPTAGRVTSNIPPKPLTGCSGNSRRPPTRSASSQARLGCVMPALTYTQSTSGKPSPMPERACSATCGNSDRFRAARSARIGSISGSPALPVLSFHLRIRIPLI